ncbi:hypothetical protein BJY01DRAFT_2295 [Aspergillus pseudoustus]|uniref:Uncharacterized protein n=1 Tax=Aspergillus pseudoustus TaxID=1810923 RepID=A0ABR4KT40_9EURO
MIELGYGVFTVGSNYSSLLTNRHCWKNMEFPLAHAPARLRKRVSTAYFPYAWSRPNSKICRGIVAALQIKAGFLQLLDYSTPVKGVDSSQAVGVFITLMGRHRPQEVPPSLRSHLHLDSIDVLAVRRWEVELGSLLSLNTQQFFSTSAHLTRRKCEYSCTDSCGCFSTRILQMRAIAESSLAQAVLSLN